MDRGMKYLGANLNVRKGLINYYNWHCVPLVKPSRRYNMRLTDNWCAMFVSVLAHEKGLTKDEFPYEVSVFYMCEIARERGQYSDGVNGVKEGDLIIYDWTGRGTYDHVGVVLSVGSGSLEVLEGNYGGTVGVRTVNRTSKAVRGFIALNSGTVQDEAERISDLVVRVMRGEYGNGEKRRELLGVDYDAVQAKINTVF